MVCSLVFEYFGNKEVGVKSYDQDDSGKQPHDRPSLIFHRQLLGIYVRITVIYKTFNGC